MKRQVNLFLFFIFFVFNSAIAQKNEIQVRYNYIGNHYEQLFGPFIPWYYNGNEEKLNNKINTHPFRFNEYNRLVRDDNFFQEWIYCKYYYLGLAFKRDSILKNYYFRFRVDKFSFNYKSETIDNGWLASIYDYRNIISETKISSIQYTLGFGRAVKWKYLEIDLGIELPFYFRGDEESFSSFSYTDSTGYHCGSNFRFNPGGWFTGISFLSSLQFPIKKHWSVGLESSCGLIYLNNYGDKQTHFIFHYPSLTFANKF